MRLILSLAPEGRGFNFTSSFSYKCEKQVILEPSPLGGGQGGGSANRFQICLKKLFFFKIR